MEEIESWEPSTLRKESKVKEWFKENWMKMAFVAAAVVLIFVLIWYLRKRQNEARGGGQAAPVPQRKVLGGQVKNGVEKKSVKQNTTGQKKAPKVQAQAPAIMCQDGLPKPFNVFQDNLVGSNDITVGPGVVSAGADGQLPMDYASACGAVNPAAVWQSSQLLPTNCGQSLEGTSDWEIYAPSNYQVTNFLSAGANFGQDTVMTTLKNASLDLRPEPPIPMSGCFQVPFGQSSWVDNALMNTDYSHSLVA